MIRTAAHPTQGRPPRFQSRIGKRAQRRASDLAVVLLPRSRRVGSLNAPDRRRGIPSLAGSSADAFIGMRCGMPPEGGGVSAEEAITRVGGRTHEVRAGVADG